MLGQKMDSFLVDRHSEISLGQVFQIAYRFKAGYGRHELTATEHNKEVLKMVFKGGLDWTKVMATFQLATGNLATRCLNLINQRPAYFPFSQEKNQ